MLVYKLASSAEMHEVKMLSETHAGDCSSQRQQIVSVLLGDSLVLATVDGGRSCTFLSGVSFPTGN